MSFWLSLLGIAVFVLALGSMPSKSSHVAISVEGELPRASMRKASSLAKVCQLR